MSQYADQGFLLTSSTTLASQPFLTGISWRFVHSHCFSVMTNLVIDSLLKIIFSHDCSEETAKLFSRKKNKLFYSRLYETGNVVQGLSFQCVSENTRKCFGNVRVVSPTGGESENFVSVRITATIKIFRKIVKNYGH